MTKGPPTSLKTAVYTQIARIGQAISSRAGSSCSISSRKVLIDVRPREEYAGHIPGALALPLADLAYRLSERRKRRDVVAYCRGPHCVMALDAVELLRRKGFRAHRLEHGVPEWRARGWRVELRGHAGHRRSRSEARWSS